MGAEGAAHDGIHIWTDLFYIEVVDAEGLDERLDDGLGHGARVFHGRSPLLEVWVHTPQACSASATAPGDRPSHSIR